MDLSRISYDPTTGEFRWVRPNVGRGRAGGAAGSKRPDGYIRICLDRQYVLAHRLAWFIVHGAWPQFGIDHINGDKSDNRIDNLRDIPQRMNCQNIRKPRGHNKSGYLGVWLHDGRYAAGITVDGKYISLGGFATPEEASDAYWKAKAVYHKGALA